MNENTYENKNIVSIKNLTKRFAGVIALNKIDLDIKEGEVHVLVGENGAGKSSLIKVLCGIYIPESGEIFYNRKKYKPKNARDAIKAGIRVVYQEFNLLPFLSVAENIYFEKLPQKGGVVDFKKLYKDTEKLLDKVGLKISPKTKVEYLGVAQMQQIEIAKALSYESKLLILDEPTATITPNEIENLFKIIKTLKKKGVTIIYISHRLQEIFEIGDRITVLRNGVKVGTKKASEVDVPEIVKMMVGKTMKGWHPFDESVKVSDKDILTVENLKYIGNKNDVSFSVKQGEILGVSGLVGSGRTETMRAIFGADKKSAGLVYVNGKLVNINNPRNAVDNGICLLTEDRKSHGLIQDMTCDINITITDLAQITKYGIILDKKKEQKVAEALVKDLNIITPTVKQYVRNLSGGNQQKVVIAKWLFKNSSVFIFDEPTRGIDVGAKYEIYLLLWKLAAQGKGIIIVSSDLPELLGICHRILVFSKGKITGNINREDFKQEEILSLAYKEHLHDKFHSNDIEKEEIV